MLTLLTRSYAALTLRERAEALLLARELGARAAGECPSSRLENPRPAEYLAYVVTQAVTEGTAGVEELDRWRDLLREGSAGADPRVQAFLFGWNEKVVEILTGLERSGDLPEVAQWFLDGVEP